MPRPELLVALMVPLLTAGGCDRTPRCGIGREEQRVLAERALLDTLDRARRESVIEGRKVTSWIVVRSAKASPLDPEFAPK
jgi:hypothetical protein